MVTNKIVWIISFGLILNGIWQAWSVYQKTSMVFFVWSVISISAGIGLLYRREWSKYFVLFLSSMSVASWFDGVFYYFQHGPRYETLAEEITGFIPGAFLITWWVCIFIYVFRYFKLAKEYKLGVRRLIPCGFKSLSVFGLLVNIQMSSISVGAAQACR